MTFSFRASKMSEFVFEIPLLYSRPIGSSGDESPGCQQKPDGNRGERHCGRAVEGTLRLSNEDLEFYDIHHRFTKMNEADETETVTVKKVCQDFRVREDGALASKLQDEEFEKHYGLNKNERRTVRGDVRVAKQTYLEEVRTAELLPEDELDKMEETDKWLARELQEKLHSEEQKELDKQAELALEDAKIAKHLQSREKEKYDRAWQRRREREILEEQERRHLQRTMDELNECEQDTRRKHTNPQSEHVAITNGHTEHSAPRRPHRGGSKEETRRSTGSGSSGGSVGKEERRKKTEGEHGSGGKEERRRKPEVEHGSGGKEERRDRRRKTEVEHGTEHGDGAVVALPLVENGGGRLEGDRIIMADGTAIDLFENEDEDDRQKALQRQRITKDEEYAKMLQEQERRIVEVEKMASDDKRIAMEEQDREYARHLQRKEYHRLQKEQKERQMRRANSVPSDRHSVSIEDPRRLPSYEEATHRNQMPDLLPGHDIPIENQKERVVDRSSYASTNSSRGGGSSSFERAREREDYLERERATNPKRERTTNQDRERVTNQERERATNKEREREDYLERERATYNQGKERTTNRERERTTNQERERTTNQERERATNQERERTTNPERERTINPEKERSTNHGKERERERQTNRERPNYPDREHYGRILNARGPNVHPSIEDRHTSSREHGHSPKDRRNEHEEIRQPSPNMHRRTDRDSKRSSDEDSPVWRTREAVHASPPSSLERFREHQQNTHGSKRSSYASSGQGSYDRRSEHTGSPTSPHAEVWERFVDADDLYEASRNFKPMSRGRTVASSHPSYYENDRLVPYNVVEGIDPTFRRERKSSEDDSKDLSAEDKAKMIPLIKPHRRRSAERKRERGKGGKGKL